MSIILKIIAAIIFIAGAAVVAFAKFFVRKYDLASKAVVKYAEELNEEELENMKMINAVLKVKLIGTLIALPGAVAVYILFRL